MHEKNTRDNLALVPEREAGEVLKKLRSKLPNVPLSVYGFVDKKNRRLVHIAADNPSDPLNDRADIYYKADDGVGKIVPAAVKKLTARFEL